jgi:signal transduction histidine kinase
VRSRILLSTSIASPRQRHSAIVVGMIVLAGFIATIPFAQIKLARFPGIIFIQNTLTLSNDTLTASLLLGQYSVGRSRALLVLAFGYLSAALMSVSHALSYPEVFSAIGLFSGTPWLYLVGHAVLPLTVIAFALRQSQSDEYPRAADRGAIVPIIFTALSAGCLALACTWLIVVGTPWLPLLVQDGRLMPASRVVVAVLLLLPLSALLILVTRRTLPTLDLWLAVVMFTWVCTVYMVSFLSAERYDVGWYVGRAFEVLTSFFVLIVLLSETIVFYARNIRAVEIERRERERRVNEMEAVLVHLSRVNEAGRNVSTLIHEISQPLSTISMLAQLSLRLPDNSADRLKKLLLPLAEQSARVMEIVQHLREFLKRNQPERGIHQMPKMIDDAVRLASLGDKSGLTVETRYHPAAASGFFDRVQIEQVVYNLLRNAIEAMVDKKAPRLNISTDCTPEGMIEISIADNGPGLPTIVRDKLFEPFVTTKTAGLGIGLSICQVIIQAHGSKLVAEDITGGGTVFRFTLPPARHDAFDT